MNEIIKITQNYKGENSVSARDLHNFLEVNSKFTDWIKNRISKYEFIENKDFILVSKILETNNPKNPHSEQQDYIISLDMAKELSMVENNEKGRQARRYFIECEKQLKEQFKVPQTFKEALQLALEQQEKIEQQQKSLEEAKPKVLFAEAVASSKSTILIGELAKLLKQNGIDVGQNKLFAWLRDNGYLIRRQGCDYNMPSQYSMNLGLFEIKETSITHADGHITVNRTPKVTGKGQQFFINKFLGGK